MSYLAQIADFRARYGTDNAALMADPDQNGDATDIAARQQLCLDAADEWVEGFLLKSLYSHKLPAIVDRNNHIPKLLTMSAVMFAGWLAATCSGVRDFDRDNKPINRYTADLQTAEKVMMMIQAGDHFLLNVEV